MNAADWDQRYEDADLVWSAGPNLFVEQICGELPPGRAIDLAAGEGRNAIWLAERGWNATAVDFSPVAIRKALAIADHRGAPIIAEVADLTEYVPTPGGYDLVLIAYLQLSDVELTPIVRRAADAVAPGGRLVLVCHDVENLEHGYGGPQHVDVLTTPRQITDALDDGLTVERAEVVERPVTTADGDRVALDTLVVARRA